jgi:SulP family sulfate permease
MTETARPSRGRERFTVLSALRSPRQLTREVLAGLVTTLALVPEVISFSLVAGVDPMVSLVASIVLALTMSILGGRPGVITAAAGSVALVIAPLVHDRGVEYLLPTVILAGIIQIVFGLAGLARLMRIIPRSVMIGFVNALGILIFVAQIPHVVNVPALAYVLFGVTLAIIVIVPRFTTAVPSPLIRDRRRHGHRDHRGPHGAERRRRGTAHRTAAGHHAVPRASEPRDAAGDPADGAQRRVRRADGDAPDSEARRRDDRHTLA